jgi:hypothetical protein
MATDFTNPFTRAANLDLAPRLMMAYETWLQEASGLETQRVERDLGVLRRGCEAIANAKDRREFNSDSQAIARDYLKATTSLLQEGIGITMRNQKAVGEAFSDAFKNWHSTWTGGFEKAAVTNPAAMPTWFKSLTMPTALAQLATERGDASPTQSGTRSFGGNHLAV